MKVIFLLDNNEYVEVAPEKLQIRQIQPGQSALGTEVTVTLRKEDGSVDLNEDGSPKVQTGFRPFINYAVNLAIPQTAEQVQEPEAVKAKTKNGKAKAAKRREN